MKKVRLLMAIAALLCMIVLTVFLGSPYAPVVQPCPENIEEIWAIEDSREESDVPLVTALENSGMPLAYDGQSGTFYCTLGLNQTESWPKMHLTAPGADGVRLMFVDDYTYDSCADAVRDGYAYQMIAYTDDAFSYMQLVFTGLPLVMIDCKEEIGDIDTPVRTAISSYGAEPVISAGNIHLRGGSSQDEEKKNFKLEFTRSMGGKRNTVSVPEIGVRDDLVLNPMVFDERLVRDRLCWELYAGMLGEDYRDGFGARKTAYAELFLNNEYMGVYLMMEPMEEDKELMKTGSSHLLTDSVYRTLPTKFERGHPLLQSPKTKKTSFELRYEPSGARQFAALRPYVNLITEEDDEKFAAGAQALMDIESAVRYVLLLQATGLSDNVANNVYIWARMTPQGMRYQFAPWDMDMSWGKAWGGMDDKFGENLDGWYTFDLLDRVVACNAGGAADLMVSRWREWRETIFNASHISELVTAFYAQLQDSGALMRNDERWGYETNPEPYAFIDFAEVRFAAIDRAMELIENRGEESPAFLRNEDPESKFMPIYEAAYR